MKRLLSGLAALGLLGAVLIGIYLMVIVPVLSRLEVADATISALDDQISQFRARAGAGTGAQQTKIEDTALLPGASGALAAVSLQELLELAADEAAISVERVRVEDPEPADGLLKIPLTAELTLTISELRDLLFRIETSDPYLFVEELSIRRRRSSQPPGEPVELLVRMRLFGFAAEPSSRQ